MTSQLDVNKSTSITDAMPKVGSPHTKHGQFYDLPFLSPIVTRNAGVSFVYPESEDKEIR